MSVKHSRPGDRVQLGTCIAWTQEPSMRRGRLVGIRNDDGCRPIERYIIRYYLPGDGDYPTGGYHTTSRIGLVPHTGDGCESR